MHDKCVIGTGRWHAQKDNAIFSQMTVHPDWQRKGVGKALMVELLALSKRKGFRKVQLSARVTALSFYQNHDFEIVGDVYPSKKTGVLHQLMVKEL